MAAEIPGERDCLIGLAPKYDAKETARQAAIEALQQRRFLDAMDCCTVYEALITEPSGDLFERKFIVEWEFKDGTAVETELYSRKNADRFAAHVGGIVRSNR